jgi:hypothetical protein
MASGDANETIFAGRSVQQERQIDDRVRALAMIYRERFEFYSGRSKYGSLSTGLRSCLIRLNN